MEPMEVGEGSGAADVDPDPVDHTVSEPDDVLEDNPDSIRETLQKEMDRQLADRFAAMTVEFESQLQGTRSTTDSSSPANRQYRQPGTGTQDSISVSTAGAPPRGG